VIASGGGAGVGGSGVAVGGAIVGTGVGGIGVAVGARGTTATPVDVAPPVPVAARVGDKATVALDRAVVVKAIDGVTTDGVVATAATALAPTLGVPTTMLVAVRVTMATGVPLFTLAVGVGAVARSLKKKVNAATKMIAVTATARYCGCR
jgi:hypothetical protein